MNKQNAQSDGDNGASHYGEKQDNQSAPQLAIAIYRFEFYL
ncbi:MAG: hypothetical protein ACR5K4_02520 [Sodalis sp. (in: enterobacteria)]